MNRDDFIAKIEEAYGWKMSKKDHPKLVDFAKKIGSGNEVINLLRVWSDEVKGRPVSIDRFLKWNELEEKYKQISIF